MARGLTTLLAPAAIERNMKPNAATVSAIAAHPAICQNDSPRNGPGGLQEAAQEVQGLAEALAGGLRRTLRPDGWLCSRGSDRHDSNRPLPA